ncbi:MAG: tetratricopeptide repeat protein, partial [Providencia sp.]
MKKIIISLLLIGSVFIHLAYAKTSPPLTDEQSLLTLTKTGKAEAQFNLAMFYQSNRQFEDALKWYGLAAAQGFTKAQINLALMYQQGTGIAKDNKLMLYWMQTAAEAGDPIGQMNMAEYTLNGIDKILAKDPQQAENWLQKAAQQDFPAALITLAYWYEKGTAVTEDPKKAEKIYLSLAQK